jgi:GNAT superfamily N-acetyltransferase
VKDSDIAPAGALPVTVRLARFEDVPEILRLIERAVEYGCRDHYDKRQRRSVYLGYASSIFLDALGPFETQVAESTGRMVGTAQIDLAAGVLRALFVDADFQGHGVGRLLLATVESHARAAGHERLRGAMSLNAIPFYRHVGYEARGGQQRIRGALASVPVLWMEKALAT